FQVYFERVKKRYVMLSEGSHYVDLSCIRSFFLEEWEEPIESLSEDARSYLLSSAASNLMALGHIDESIVPMQSSIGSYLENEMWLEAAGSAGPYISMLIETGNLVNALDTLDQFKNCVNSSQNVVIEAMDNSFRGYACHLNGRSSEAGIFFGLAEEILQLEDPGVEVNFPTVSSYYIKFLLETGRVDEALQRSNQTFSWRKNRAWQTRIDAPSVFASDVLVAGLIYMRKGEFAKAKQYLDEQISIFRGAHEWLYIPTGLSYRAAFFIEIEDFESAEMDLDEALQISLKSGALFCQWEALINYSALNIKKEKFDAARNYLEKALSIPKMRAYKFRDNQIREYAEKLGMQVNLD
ncbi:MAG: hypothetical protein RLP12_04310, partial [Ekhidna sp.]